MARPLGVFQVATNTECELEGFSSYGSLHVPELQCMCGYTGRDNYVLPGLRRCWMPWNGLSSNWWCLRDCTMQQNWRKWEASGQRDSGVGGRPSGRRRLELVSQHGFLFFFFVTPEGFTTVGNFYWCKISQNVIFALQEFSRFLFLHKQDTAIDHTFECHASLPSLHINEKISQLPLGKAFLC